jgi:probable addiction module antidote protein
MSEQFTRWDPVDQLQSEEDMAMYLDACLEEDPGDGSVVRAALNDIARAQGMTQLAKATGITREGLYKALAPTGNPEFSTILKVIKALKIKLHASTGATPMAATFNPLVGSSNLPRPTKKNKKKLCIIAVQKTWGVSSVGRAADS